MRSFILFISFFLLKVSIAFSQFVYYGYPLSSEKVNENTIIILNIPNHVDGRVQMSAELDELIFFLNSNQYLFFDIEINIFYGSQELSRDYSIFLSKDFEKVLQENCMYTNYKVIPKGKDNPIFLDQNSKLYSMMNTRMEIVIKKYKDCGKSVNLSIFTKEQIINAFNKYSEEEQKLQIFYKKSAIPNSLKKTLKNKFGNFHIVNPDKKYRRTDIVRNPFVANKQLLFLIKDDDNYFLVFRQGGRGLTTYFIFSKIISGKVIELSIYTISNKVETYKDFLKIIKNGDFFESNI